MEQPKNCPNSETRQEHASNGVSGHVVGRKGVVRQVIRVKSATEAPANGQRAVFLGKVRSTIPPTCRCGVAKEAQH